MNPEEIFGKEYTPFEEIDPYNPGNKVNGFICRKPNEYYGALIVNRVNDREVTPQLIMATPKMHYPFDVLADGITRKYKFPSAKNIEIYEKLDGTNILSYFYCNAEEYRFLTFKTRLRPFLGSGKFGDFYALWNEVATPHFNSIKKAMTSLNCNISFELWGARNPHIIAYKTPLTFSILFGVTPEGSILSPQEFQGLSFIHPDRYVKKLLDIDKDYVWNYEELQKKIQSGLIKDEDGYYFGSEGAVWYLHTINGKCLQIKCKPETIEAIHFSAGVGINKNVILATVWNALENTDDPTVDFIKQLLLEEFPAHQIEANHSTILKCIEFVKKESQFKNTVFEVYKKIGKNILLEKNEVMRELSKSFPKDKMKKVYSLLVQQ